MAFSNQELAKITGYTGQMGGGRHGVHVRSLGEKVKQGDQDALNRLRKMNKYLGQFPGYEGAKYAIPEFGSAVKSVTPPPMPLPTGIPYEEGSERPVISASSSALKSVTPPPPQIQFSKQELARISGYDQSEMFRGFGATVDSAMGQGRHGNYVFDLLAKVRAGGADAAAARQKLEAMNQYFSQIPGYEGAKIDIEGASFSDKPVNKELRQVTGYTGFFGPDAKARNQPNFGNYVEQLRDTGDFDTIAKINQVLEKHGYVGHEVSPTSSLYDTARDRGYMGPSDDIDAIGRFLSYQGSKESYVDEYGQFTPTGRQAILAERPELPEGTRLDLAEYQSRPDEFLDADKYKSTPTRYNVEAAQGTVAQAMYPEKTEARTYDAIEKANQVAKEQIEAARQLGLTDYVDAQTAEVDVKSTVQGQLASLMQQFEGGQIPAFAAGAIRVAEQKLAARGMGASSMAGAAIMQAAMEASTPIAAADAETYRRMSELNLNNRQQAEVLNAQMTMQMDLKNLDNDQQARVINTNNRVQSLFNDQAAVNSARQFNAKNEQQNDQFFASLFSDVAKFNASQQNAMAQFNAGQENQVQEFNSQLASQREQFETKNSILIDQANAVYRRQINTANTAIQNAENEYNTRNLFNISQQAMANILQQHRDELNYARAVAFNQADFAQTLAQISFAHDKNIDLAADATSGAAFIKILGSISEYFLT